MKFETQPAAITQRSRRSVALAASVLFLLLSLSVVPATAQEGGTNRAGIVIQYGDGRVQTACVDLGPDGEATGEELLRAVAPAVIVDYSFGTGGTVCRIGADGCDFPAQKCFCQCTMKPGDPCIYWSYFHLLEGQWRYSIQGASSYRVKPGDVEGWAWGSGSTTGGTLPPLIPFEQLCSDAAPTAPPPSPTSAPVLPTATPTAIPATATATTTATERPPTATPPPTGPTRAAAATALPTPTETASPTPRPSATATLEEVAAAPSPTAPAATLTPTVGEALNAAPTPTASETEDSGSNYLVFGGLVVVLLLGLLFLQMRGGR